jgi:hypothetical protein
MYLMYNGGWAINIAYIRAIIFAIRYIIYCDKLTFLISLVFMVFISCGIVIIEKSIVAIQPNNCIIIKDTYNMLHFLV